MPISSTSISSSAATEQRSGGHWMSQHLQYQQHPPLPLYSSSPSLSSAWEGGGGGVGGGVLHLVGSQFNISRNMVHGCPDPPINPNHNVVASSNNAFLPAAASGGNPLLASPYEIATADAIPPPSFVELLAKCCDSIGINHISMYSCQDGSDNAMSL